MQLTHRSKSLVLLIFVLFFFFSSVRLIFAAIFSTEASGYVAGEFQRALYLGAKFDMRVSLVLALPMVLIFWLPPLDPFKTSRARKVWSAVYSVVFFLLTSLVMVDIAYYQYLNGRVNATILEFFKNPLISAQMVWASYPVVWMVLGAILFFYLSYRFLGRFIFPDRPGKPVPLKRKWASGVIIFIFFVGGLHGKLSQYPLRWSEAYFSTNTFISALAMNPLHYLVDTFNNRKKSFDVSSTKELYPRMSSYLNVENPSVEKPHFQRPVPIAGPFQVDPNNPPNIVIVLLESLAAYKTGALGHPLKPTPYMDEVAKKGLLFTEFYVPSEATARSIYCLITGIPDVNDHNGSSSRNPLIINQNTVVNAFSGYEKYYFIGGSANWGNIRGVITNNIDGVHLYDEESLKSPRNDVWGVSDLHLFREAHQILTDRSDSRPFIAFIQAAGFHRPYTIPDDQGKFESVQLDEANLKKYGFLSNAEYNSLRFQDYAFGEFYQLAKNDPKFKNTIFVITGDHGLPDYQAEHVYPGSRHFNLERWRVPLVFYGPGLIEPGVNDDIATQPDILPTLAGMTGHSYTNTTLGKNLFSEDRPKYAFNFVYYQNPPQIGVLDKEFYAIGMPGKMRGLYKYRTDQFSVDVKEQYPDKWQEMSRMAEGFYETARYMLFHNPKLNDSDNAQK